jgi:hypothetical protein
MATLWFNFPPRHDGRISIQKEGPIASFPAKQPDVDFLVPVSSRFTGMTYAKEVFTMLMTGRNEAQFIWEPLHGRGGSGEDDILKTNLYAEGKTSYMRDYPYVSDSIPTADGNGSFLLARIRTDEFWLDIRLGDQYFVPIQKIQDFPQDELIYSKIARIPRDDAKELFRSLAISSVNKDLSSFNALVHVGMGINEGEREEPYCFLNPTQAVDELDAELEAYMTQ